MCHLCRKIEKLEGIESKAAKPLFVVLSKLHKHVSQHLGDMYLWRLAQTTNLQNLLKGIYKSMPVAPLKAILEEVDSEIQHVRKGMVDHPSMKGVGKLDVLKKDITPSESPSVRMRTVIEMEIGRKLTQSETEEKIGGGALGRATDDERKLWATMPELPGSDRDPPMSRIYWSIKYVEEWMEKCDTAMGAGERTKMENTSMVSLLRGGILERPPLDVGVWKRRTRRSKSKNGRSRTRSYNDKSNTTNKKPTSNFSECVYDKPPEKIELNMRVMGEVVEVAASERQQECYEKNLATLLFMKKAEKLSKSRRISIDDAVQLLRAKKLRAERKFTMSGARSNGPSSRISTDTFRANSSQGRSSFSSNRTSVQLTRSEVQTCAKKAGAGIELKKVETWESASESDRTDSSRDSVINMGSIVGREHRGSGSEDAGEESDEEGIQQPRPVKVYQRRRGSVSYNASFRPSTPKPIRRSKIIAVPSQLCSRESVVNLGSLVEQPRLVNEYQPWGGSVSSNESFRPSTPKPIGKARSVAPASGKKAEDIKASSQPAAKPQKSFAEHMKTRERTVSGASDITVSPAVLASRRRRAERNASVPKMDRYRNEERQRLWKE